MNKWKQTILIKHLLTEDESVEAISNASQGIAQALQATFPDQLDWDNEAFDDSLYSVFEYLGNNTIENLISDEEQGFEIVEEFNYWLSDLYDWADANRVWIG